MDRILLSRLQDTHPAPIVSQSPIPAKQQDEVLLLWMYMVTQELDKVAAVL